MKPDIKDLLKEAKKKYYQDGTSPLSDSEYDYLESRVGNDLDVGYEIPKEEYRSKLPHPTRVLSLDKISIYKESDDEFQQIVSWLDSKNIPDDIKIEFTPKLDGNSVNIIYKNHELCRILTRGNGGVGIDITSKLSNKVPPTIQEGGIVEMRAEAIMKDKTFQDIYSADFKNSRNLVSGLLTSKNASTVDVNVIIFEKKSDDNWSYPGDDFKEYNIDYSIIVPRGDLDLEGIKNIYHKYKLLRGNNDYQLDGIVIKINDNIIRNKLGITTHHPNYAIAIKFPPKEVSTQVKGIFYSLGKSGDVTPIILLDPVDLDGSTVSKCSGHNMAFLLKHQINVGAIVTIAKRGDIIPQIERVVIPSDEKLILPEFCDSCGTKLKKDEIRLYCDNPSCDGIQYKKLCDSIVNYNIDNLGDATIKKLFDKGMRRAYELFFVGDIQEYIGEDNKNYEKIYNQIKTIKKIPLVNLILDFGITNLGDTLSKHIAKKYAGIEVDTKGLQMKIYEGFIENNFKELDELIERFKTIGIEVVLPEDNIKKDTITFEMTGSPKPYFNKKDEVINFTTQFNWVHTSLNANTTYLLVDDVNSSSTKMKKAKSQGTKIMTYEELLNLKK